MVIGVPIAPVWGSKNLLKPPDVRAFMKQYTKDNVQNSLKDLNGVDFWWTLANLNNLSKRIKVDINFKVYQFLSVQYSSPFMAAALSNSFPFSVHRPGK